MAAILRSAQASDLPVLTDIYNYYVEHTAYTFDLDPWSLEQRESWLRGFGLSGRYRLLVAEVNGRVAGYASSARFHPKAAYESSVEVSVYLDGAFAGRGLGTLLYDRLFEELSGEDVHRAYAGITVPNPTSVALHEKFGFQLVARYDEAGRKFGRYWSVEWFEKRFA